MNEPFKLAFTAIAVVITVLICVVLQVVLSRKPNKLWGWLLPAAFFIISFFIGFSRLIFHLGGPGGIVGGDFYLFFLANVPTIIMLSIYFPIRHRAAGKGEGLLLALKNDQEEDKTG
ncbi:MAG: hypothetical protein PHN35_01695 [Clostridia bacterium]|nr:hypothetical protein [Clostridia bacterium]MDD4798188.1 hypothetical protein [Clostridia bacterium]